jgi:hypothetical protein
MSEELDLARSIHAQRRRDDWSDVAWAEPEIEYAGGCVVRTPCVDRDRRDGKIARYREFCDEHEALNAVGLEE